MRTVTRVPAVLLAVAALGSSSWPAAASDGPRTLPLDEVLSVYRALALAKQYIEIGFQEGEASAPRENMAQAERYLSRAEELIGKERAECLLQRGWVLFKRRGEYREVTRKMLGEALALDPDNPLALYKVAFVELEIYFADLPGYTKKPQREIKLPDGNVALLEPIYLSYSSDHDNSKLEYARELLEKAVAIDPTLATAYYELGHIHGFKGDEPSLAYNILFLKHRDSIDMELIFYNEGTKRQLIKNALQSVKLHAPEKLEELGLGNGYVPVPTPTPAS